MKTQTPARKAINTLTQGLVLTIACALIVGLFGAWTSATSWSTLGATLLGWSFVQAIGTAGLTYLMREVVDRYRGGPDQQ